MKASSKIVALFGALAITLAGCTPERQSIPATSSSSPRTSASPTPNETERWPRGPFGHNCLPDNAGGRGDFDGDGNHDLVRFSPVYRNESLSGWVLRQQYDGRSITTKVDAECPEVIGAADVDQDGDDELFFATGKGMTAALIDLLVYRDVELREVSYRLKLTLLYVGGSNAAVSNLRCYPAGGVSVLEITTVDHVEQRVTATTYVLMDGVLRKTATYPIRGDASGRLRCFGLRWKAY